MAKKPKVAAVQLKPKRILAFETLLNDGEDEGEDLTFVEEKKGTDVSFLQEGEVNIVDLVDLALKDKSLVPRDLKFDDSACPQAKNFLEWVTSPHFLKQTPYLEQALIGLRLFGEICPRCSDLDWLPTEAHEPQEGLAGIRKHLTLLEHGECPKCGARRSELMHSKELNFYNELAVNAGQRCVGASTPVITERGLLPISHMFIGHDSPGFHLPRMNMCANTGNKLDRVKQLYVSTEGATKRVVLQNGMHIDATPDHPLRTETGFKRVKKLTTEDHVQICLGTNVWGKKVTLPITIEEAGLATRDAALEFLRRNSLPIENDKLIYTSTAPKAQMAWCILLNAGFLPVVRNAGDEYSVVFDLNSQPITKSLFIKIDSIEDTDDQITYDLVMDGMPQFIAGGLLNHNSGKSIVVAMCSTYLTHIILKSQSPTGILGISNTTILHGTFVALTQSQAKDTLWTPYFNMISDSPWFQKYHEVIRRQERKYGIEVMKIRDTFVLYGHRNLIVYPAGPDGRILRGRTRIFGALDEIAYFDNDADSKKVKVSAGMVYGALDRSLATVRAAEDKLIAAGYDRAFTGYMFNVSSPVHARDKINELMRSSVGSTKLLGIHAPTWKMNPTMPRNSPFLEEAFRRDPVGAARDYGAEAPLSANPFITQPVFVSKAIREKGRNMCVYSHKIVRHKDGSRQRYGTLVKAATTTQPSIMALDAGYSNNSFAMVVGSRNAAGIISVDCIAEIIPLPGIPLNYTLIFDELLLPLCQKRNVKVLLADQWNSIKLLQDAKLKGGITEADKYSLKYQDLWTVKTLLESEVPRLSLPRMQHAETIADTLLYDGEDYPYCFEGKPTEHLIMQIQTVQDTGRSVIKNMGATDDSWRAMALMVWGFESGNYEEALTIREEVHVNRDPSRLGVSKGRRNTGSASSTALSSGNPIGSVRTRRIGQK
ncbi:putative terminase [Dickeya phage vB_DsoM_JA33]|uniref:Putative terminase n=2 Tax=Salmondvirus JA11 TaxID=2734141 RepID=A0A386K4W9_9CAUD|nr:terminase large subunit [Dickeya phage vB_DsoM_JA11]AXG67377.1 putative terminase [Dickeya phage vB_DsoM_JA33]AYD79808.1 putative terminase [Dickeya phage vB_DsoM_JA11]